MDDVRFTDHLNKCRCCFQMLSKFEGNALEIDKKIKKKFQSFTKIQVS